MSRGRSYGGGPSSLGYLFDADEQPKKAAVSPKVQPPYGTDTDIEKETPPRHVQSPPPADKDKQNGSNNYHRARGQNLGNFLTDRPSTKVKSVPGGDSSVGYLFGDK